MPVLTKINTNVISDSAITSAKVRGDVINGTTTHKDAIVAIKTKWPKDNSGPVE
jgi:hypothetical protein